MGFKNSKGIQKDFKVFTFETDFKGFTFKRDFKGFKRILKDFKRF